MEVAPWGVFIGCGYIKCLPWSNVDACPSETIFIDVPVIIRLGWSWSVSDGVSHWFHDVIFIFGDHFSALALVCFGEVRV